MEEIKEAPSGVNRLKQFELFYISKFLTFPELSKFFQLSRKFTDLNPIVKEDKESNIHRLKSISDQKLASVIRKAMPMGLISSSQMKCGELLNKATFKQLQYNLTTKLKGKQKRILKEVQQSYQILKDSLICCIQVNFAQTYRFVLKGPPDSVYREGYFVVEITFPIDYPFKCFQLQFLTPIYIPIVNDEGKICCCCFKDDWVPTKKFHTLLRDLLHQFRSPTDTLEQFSCILRPEVANEIKINLPMFQKKAIATTRQNAKFSLEILLRDPLK